jgi:hypothetical protein
LRNEHLGDHQRSDAGLYDLLLHARDRPFTADEVVASVERAGLSFAGFIEAARYDPATWLTEAPKGLTPAAAAALAEQLAGGIKAHVFYAAKGPARVARPGPTARPRLRGVTASGLAGAAGKGGTWERDGAAHRFALPKGSADLLRLMDGRRRLGEIAATLGLDWIAFSAQYAPVHRTLTGFGALLYSERLS